MLRGDLQTTPLADLLRRLAAAKATGCVYLQSGAHAFDTAEATVTLREGAIYGVSLPRSRDALGTRLIATNRLTPDELAEAKLAQRTELANWALADLLIHLGLADEQHVQTVTGEQAMADLTEISSWNAGSWRFRRSARLARSLPSPLPVDEALVDIGIRRAQWRDLLPAILGADAVVSLAADPDRDAGAPEQPAEASLELNAEAFTLLCAVDGTRTIAELAAACGFTLLETGGLIAHLVGAGLAQVTREMSDDEPQAAERAEQEADLEVEQAAQETTTGQDPDAGPALDPLTAAFVFDGDGRLLPEDMRRGFSPIGAAWEDPSWTKSDPLADALARVSAALSEAMSAPEPQAQPPAEPESPADLVTPVFSDLLEPTDEPAEEIIDEPAGSEAFEEPVAAEEVFAEVFAEAAAVDDVATDVAAPEPEPLSRAGRADNAAEAARLLSQLAGDTGAPASDPELETEAETKAEAEPDETPPAAPAGYTPAPRRQTGPADTAALLRELSSLGAEGSGSQRPSAPRPAPATTPNSQPAQQRKRKGLFGRS